MDQKIEFINEWKSGKFSFLSLCEAFGISRTLGYKVRHRYEEEKEVGLLPRSRSPESGNEIACGPSLRGPNRLTPPQEMKKMGICGA